jgi:dihydrofolate reductase
MIISAIVATAKNRVIGKDNDIPWYLPADLKYFKRTTLNHHIIMGRKSYQSIGRPLPKRTNIIVTRDPFFISSNCLVARSIEEALEFAQKNGETEAFIIGGGQIYEQSMPYWNRLYLTEVDLEVEGDVFFPELDLDEWALQSSEAHEPDEKNEFGYTFLVYERKAKSQHLEE